MSFECHLRTIHHTTSECNFENSTNISYFIIWFGQKHQFRSTTNLAFQWKFHHQIIFCYIIFFHRGTTQQIKVSRSRCNMKFFFFSDIFLHYWNFFFRTEISFEFLVQSKVKYSDLPYGYIVQYVHSKHICYIISLYISCNIIS